MQLLHGQSGHQGMDHALSVVLLCWGVASLAHRLEGWTRAEVNVRQWSFECVNKLKPRYTASHDNTYSAT